MLLLWALLEGRDKNGAVIECVSYSLAFCGDDDLFFYTFFVNPDTSQYTKGEKKNLTKEQKRPGGGGEGRSMLIIQAN